jgi:hypothetical protein
MVCSMRCRTVGELTQKNKLQIKTPGLEIGTGSIDWAQLSGFYLKTEYRIQFPKRCVLNKTRRCIISRNIIFALMYHRHKFSDLI